MHPGRLLAAILALPLTVSCRSGSPKQDPGDTDALVREAAAARGCTVTAMQGRVATLRCRGDLEMTADLTNLDRQLQTIQDVEQRKAAALAFLGGAADLASQASSGAAKTDPSAVPSAQLRAAIKPRAVLEATMERLPPTAREKGAIAALPLAGDAVVTLVIDRPDTMEIVTRQHLDGWKVEPAALLRRAVENLEALPYKVARLSGAGEPAIVGVAMGDSYDAARLLCPKIRAAVEAELGGPAVYAIPTRELLAAAKASDAAAVRNLRSMARDRQQDAYSVTAQILAPEGAGFRVVQ